MACAGIAVHLEAWGKGLMFDVIIIGAGPAGSSAARIVAQDGWRVALLERSEYPGQRNVCGGGIEETDNEDIGVPDHLIHRRILRREHHFPWGVTTISNPHLTFLRREFDRWLAEEAVAAGAELCVRTRARRIVHEATGQVAVTVDDLAFRREIVHRARMVIFADGPHTLAPRSGNLGFFRTPTTAGVGLIYELGWSKAPLDYYEIHFGAHISSWGYIWVFPKRELLNVGITHLPSRKSSRHLEARLRTFIKSQPDLRECPITRRVGGHIPIVPAQRIYDDSMLAVGDAAGMVEAFTEAGIANGVVGGRLAGQVACEALGAGDYSARFLSRFQSRWQATSRYRLIRFQSRLARVLLPLGRLDANCYAKLIQVLFLGSQLTRWQKLRLLAFPLLRQHTA
jgi:digeranylgeranylglycerophospholipid reductase